MKSISFVTFDITLLSPRMPASSEKLNVVEKFSERYSALILFCSSVLRSFVNEKL